MQNNVILPHLRVITQKISHAMEIYPAQDDTVVHLIQQLMIHLYITTDTPSDDTAVQLIQQVMIDRLVAICHRFGLHLRLQFPMLHPCLHKLEFFSLEKYISKCNFVQADQNLGPIRIS